MKNLKETGITLIALVVTIIILLILAGVTIGMATSGTGLFDKAKEATEKYQNAQDEEETQLGKINNEIDDYIKGNRGTVTLSQDDYDMLINANSYSDKEKVIGKWINDEPLYKKTIIVDPWSGSYGQSISLGIGADKVDKMISYDVVGYDKNNRTYVMNSLSWQYDNNNLANGFRVVYLNSTDSMFLDGMGTAIWDDLDSVIITVKYTKKATP